MTHVHLCTYGSLEMVLLLNLCQFYIIIHITISTYIRFGSSPSITLYQLAFKKKIESQGAIYYQVNDLSIYDNDKLHPL